MASSQRRVPLCANVIRGAWTVWDEPRIRRREELITTEAGIRNAVRWPQLPGGEVAQGGGGDGGRRRVPIQLPQPPLAKFPRTTSMLNSARRLSRVATTPSNTDHRPKPGSVPPTNPAAHGICAALIARVLDISETIDAQRNTTAWVSVFASRDRVRPGSRRSHQRCGTPCKPPGRAGLGPARANASRDPDTACYRAGLSRIGHLDHRAAGSTRQGR